MMKKKGFTLIELIVVLAILAIIMAIAVPVAFGSIERTKDKASATSTRNIARMADLARSLAHADSELHGLLTTNKQATIYYKDGAYYTSAATPDKYEEYVLKSIQGNGIQLEKDVYFVVSVLENLQANSYRVLVTYSKEGYTDARPMPKPKFPNFMYDSLTGQVLKNKSATESEVVIE